MMTPDAFFQATGHVITGALASIPVTSAPGPVTSAPGSQLLSLPGGTIVVSILNVPAAPPELVIENNTGTAVVSVADGSGEHPIAATGTTSIAFPTLVSGGSQLHLHISPAGALPEVISLIVSVENANGALSAVGQAFAGVPS